LLALEALHLMNLSWLNSKGLHATKLVTVFINAAFEGRAMAGLLAHSPNSKGRFCGNEVGRAWPMHG
jgi:hypothetical protein